MPKGIITYDEWVIEDDFIILSHKHVQVDEVALDEIIQGWLEKNPNYREEVK